MFTHLSQRSTSSSTKQQRAFVTEALEGRRMFTNFLASNGVLSIAETNYSDHVVVSDNGAVITIREEIVGVAGSTRVTQYLTQKLRSMAISTYDGRDWVENNTRFPSYIDVGTGDDLVDGGYGNDTIFGGDGSDIIYSKAGNDYVDAMAGDNVVSAGDGRDTVYAYNGTDHLYGGNGDDYIRTWGGNDVVCGDEGFDVLIAGAGNDTVYGGTGGDSLWGEDGDDYLVGGDGPNDRYADLLIGGAGNDRFATHWVWYSAGGWQNISQVNDFQNYNYGWGLDTWVNP